MRKLAAFTVSFALGICLAQYLLPERLLLPVAAVFFAAACLALLLPGLWRKRVLLVGTGLALALGWNWLYSYAVRAPLAALSGSEGTASMTLLEYAVPTDYGAKVTVKLEGVPPGQGGLLRRGGPAGPGAGTDSGGTGEISGFRPASGGYHYQLHRSGSVPAGLPAGRRSRLR